MAKKTETPAPEAERAMPVHPDLDKETVLLRDPQNGAVKVLAREAHKDKKTGKVHMPTVEPSLKNQPAFYELKDSRALADMIANFRRQSQNPTPFPEIYRVPFNLVAQGASQLLKLQVDKNDLEGLSAQKNYRTSTQQLEKIMFDEVRMPKAELQAMGFDIAEMEKQGTFKEMALGKDSSKLYPLSIKTGENISLEGMYSIRPKQHETEKDKICFEVQSPLAIPEFLLDEELKTMLNAQEKEDLRSGKTLDRVLKHDGEYCYAAFNRRTNRMIYIPCKDVIVPNFIYNARVTSVQQEELKRGGRVMLEDCHYFGSDIKFRGAAQFDVHRMEFNIAKPYYSRAYIPEFIDRQLTKEMRTALMNHEEIDGRKLVGRNGERYTNNLRISPETLGLEFVQYRRPEQAQEMAQAPAPSEQVREEEAYHIPDGPTANRAGQSIGM